MTRAMLLCAGLSTRLGALGQQRPKPMLPVCDIPILHYGIANLVAHGVRDIVINQHHHGDLIESALGDGSSLGARIQYTYEEEILGTGGGLKNALALLDPDGKDEPFLSCNGKLIFDLDFGSLLAAFDRDPDILGMMVVRRVPDAVSWGAVDVDESGPWRVRNILGEGRFMFCGVHVTRPSTVERLPDGEACMVRQGYLPWLQSGEAVAAFEAPDVYFAEHSTPWRYLQSNLDLLGGAALSNPPGPLTGIDADALVPADCAIEGPVRIGSGARIGAGCVIGPRAVVGAGAEVAPGTRIRDSVVWPGARAEGELDHAIVTDGGTLKPTPD